MIRRIYALTAILRQLGIPSFEILDGEIDVFYSRVITFCVDENMCTLSTVTMPMGTYLLWTNDYQRIRETTRTTAHSIQSNKPTV